MNHCHVVYSKNALKELKKLDTYISRLIVGWMNKNIEGYLSQRIYGKILVLVLNVGHRKEVYKG